MDDRSTAARLLDRAQAARRSGGNPLQALADAQTAADLLRSEGGAELALAVKWVGQLERDLGRTALALQAYEQSVALYSAAGDRRGQAHSARHVADILVETGQASRALAVIEAVIDLYRHASPPPLEFANALRVQALARQAVADESGADAAWSEALTHYHAAGVSVEPHRPH